MKTMRRWLFPGWVALVIGLTAGPAATAPPATTPAGTPDLSFGDSTSEPGRMLTDFRAQSADQAQSVALQADGKIVVGGSSSAPNNDSNFALTRYLPNGSLDTSFGDSTSEPGRVLTDFRAQSYDQLRAVVIQPDGKIIAAGFTDAPSGGYNFALVRYLPTGSIDTSFGDSTSEPGRVITDARAESHDEVHAIALQPDGKIVVAGFSSAPNGDANFALVRYNANGSLDTSFGDSTLNPGRVLTDFRTLPDGRRSHDEAWAIAIQPDGTILVAGTTDSPNGDNNFALVRYLPNGSVDPSFGDSTLDPGRVITDFRARSRDDAQSMTLQPDGKIVVAGFTDAPNGDSNFALARYNPNGSIDTSFGDSTLEPGRVITDFRDRSLDAAYAVALQPDGKLIAGGLTTAPNRDWNFALVRYLPNGPIDTSFGDSTLNPGRAITDFRDGSHDEVRAIALQPDGKIVAVGFSSAPNNTDNNFALVRYLGAPAGSPPPVTPPPTNPPPPPASGPVTVRLSAATVMGGSPVTATVIVATAADQEVDVEMTSSRPDVVEIPFSLLTLPGPAEVNFPFVTHPVTSPTAVQITVKLVDPDTAAPLGTTSTTLTVTP